MLAVVFVSVPSCQGGAGNHPSGSSERLTAGDHARYVTVDGIRRSYLVHVPDLPADARSVPVVLAFHGAWGTATKFANVTGLTTRATRARWIVVYPQGFRRSWNAGDCCGAARDRGIDDVAFVRALLDDLEVVAPIDRRRVFATGFSNGAKMVYRLACELSEEIAAIAPVSATMSVAPKACHPSRAVPVLHLHGKRDGLAPFNGGESAYLPLPPQRSVPSTLEYWLVHNKCNAQKRVTFKRRTATCVTSRDCRGTGEVVLCTIGEMGHQWPGGNVVLPRLLGPGTDDLSATTEIVRFFSRYARSGATTIAACIPASSLRLAVAPSSHRDPRTSA